MELISGIVANKDLMILIAKGIGITGIISVVIYGIKRIFKAGGDKTERRILDANNKVEDSSHKEIQEFRDKSDADRDKYFRDKFVRPKD